MRGAARAGTVVMLALALLDTGEPPVAAAAESEWTAEADATYFMRPTRFPGTFEAKIWGGGHASFMGGFALRARERADFVVRPGFLVSDGEFTLTGASGSVRATYREVLKLTPLRRWEGGGTFEIVAGTGAYSGASGAGVSTTRATMGPARRVHVELRGAIELP